MTETKLVLSMIHAVSSFSYLPDSWILGAQVFRAVKVQYSSKLLLSSLRELDLVLSCIRLIRATNRVRCAKSF